jgi:hypothetical protein
MKRHFVILFGLLLLFNSILANDDFRKEKKELKETIKTSYVSWLERDYHDWLMANSSTVPGVDSTEKFSNYCADLQVQASKLAKPYIPESVVSANKLKDFKFSILNDQAIVKFKVAQNMKSAFLEKKDGSWELVFVADLVNKP